MDRTTDQAAEQAILPRTFHANVVGIDRWDHREAPNVLHTLRAGPQFGNQRELELHVFLPESLPMDTPLDVTIAPAPSRPSVLAGTYLDTCHEGEA